MHLTTPIDDLPEWANRIRWARILNMHPSTLAKAQKKGTLGRGIYQNSRVLFISKKEILDWLNIPYEETGEELRRPLKLKPKFRLRIVRS